jgi:hypothetical protein
VIPPGLGPAASSSRSAVRICRASRCSLRLTGQPAGLPLAHMISHRVGCRRVPSGLARRVRLSSVPRRHDDQAPGCLGPTSIAVFDLRLSEHAWAMPAPGALRLGPPGLLSQPGQRGRRLAPGCQCRPAGPGARDQSHSAHTACEAPPPCPAPIRLTSRHDPPHPFQAPSQARLQGEGRCHTGTPVAIPHPAPQGQPAIATPPETQEHWLEVVPAILAVPLSRPGRSGSLRPALLRPLERTGRGVLMPPGGRDGGDLEGCECQRPTPLMAIGRTQRIEEVPQPVIRERTPRACRLQQREQAPCVPPVPPLREGMLTVPKRQNQGFAPTPSRQRMRRVRRDEAVNHGGHLQAPSAAQEQR